MKMRKWLAIGVLAWAAALSAAPPAPSSADRTQTASGTVTSVQASARTVVVALADGSEGRFVWTDETKINGVLSPGARVTVRYEPAPDGRNLALQITVARS